MTILVFAPYNLNFQTAASKNKQNKNYYRIEYFFFNSFSFSYCVEIIQTFVQITMSILLFQNEKLIFVVRWLLPESRTKHRACSPFLKKSINLVLKLC